MTTDDPRIDTHQKALALNLDPTTFGSFAEIGAGQEVARWFLLVGAASGTVAKTVSAYDKAVSDDLYGSGSRYVSRQRLEAMLDREWAQLQAQLAPARGASTRFFAFADTVSARNYAGTNECHGWMGLRFQECPRGAPGEIVLHVNMRDPANVLQQEALGLLGVNLVHGAFHRRGSGEELVDALADGIDAGRLEIDLVDFSGPVFAGWDRGGLLVRLVRAGLAEAVSFPVDGRALPPTELLHRKPVVIEPGSFETVEPIHGRILAASMAELGREAGDEVLGLFALPAAPGREGGAPVDPPEILRRVEALKGLGSGVLVTRNRELYAMSSLVNRFSVPAVRFAVGLPVLLNVFEQIHYRPLPGQLLEGIARLFAHNVRVDAHPMEEAALEARVAGRAGAGWSWSAVGGWVTADRLRPAPPLDHLYAYLVANGVIRPVPPPVA